MHTITFFAPKGGAGRTTAVMATASAFIEQGHRVGVLDMTGQARLSPSVGRSFIEEWRDSMIASGVSAEDLTTDVAWDRKSLRRAEDHFISRDCTRVLVDTPKAPNDLVEYMFMHGDLTVMPFTGYVEASWIGNWIATHFCPASIMFGLATGLTGTDEQQAVQREALHGSPILKHGLPHSEVFANQLVDGSFYKLKAGTRPSDYTEAELLHARSAATALTKELNTRINARSVRGYPMREPLATGHPFAHLEVLRATSPEAFC